MGKETSLMTTEDGEQEQDKASEDPPKKNPEIDDADIDEALEETFPASDPPAY
jgi:hypothetical protein